MVDRSRSEVGFTLIELLLVVTIIGVVAALATPGLLRARMAGNEASAIGSIRAINSGQMTFASTCGMGGYASTLDDLFKPPPSGPGFISPDLATNGSIKSGYVFALAASQSAVTVTPGAGTCNTSANPAVSSYFVTADPLAFGETGSRYFASDNRGAIFQNVANAPLVEPLAPNPPDITPLD